MSKNVVFFVWHILIRYCKMYIYKKETIFVGIKICGKRDGGNIHMNADIFEWIQTFAAVFALGSVLLMRKQMKKEYDCRRREQTVQLAGRWSDNLHPNINRIKRVCEKLSSDQCRKIYNEEEFHASKEIYQEIVGALELKKKKQKTKKKNKCNVTAEMSSKMRWELVFYLNHLETVLVSWQHYIADEKIIEDQFSFFVG